MAELTPGERLQPSLLGRLTDDDPRSQKESRDQRVLSIQQLRAGVIRDLDWLLNTGHFEAVEPLEDYPEVQRSTLNYGLPELTGLSAASIDPARVQQAIRRAIVDYEPRILADSVTVLARVEKGQMSHNTVTFEIEGDLWAYPIPVHLYLKTEFDLEDGSVSVLETSG